MEVESGNCGMGGSSELTGNSALLELDNGLRSSNIGLQSESIVRFPGLFIQYPFPILINSASLKLADIYRTYPNNFVKFNILRVFERSKRFLPQITNMDEFVKRISVVLHSNDPLARSLTLRLLGTLSSVIPERKHIHSSIRNALESHDAVELQAAIFASSQFAAVSKTFSVNMCQKISSMIRGYDTPLDIKLQLIPIFRHMYHDMQTAKVVRKTCTDMLPNYPATEFVLITLNTLTRLSARTRVDLPEQVQLLLTYLNSDPRKKIQKAVLQDLRFLASEDRGHLWDPSNVTSVINFAFNLLEGDGGEEEVVLIGALTVLCDLVKNSSLEKFDLEMVLNLSRKCCFRNNINVSAKSTTLFTLICVNENNLKEDEIYLETIMSVESLFLLLNSEIVMTGVLKETLNCIVMLCNSYPKACEQFVDIVQLSAQNDENMILLCTVLAALGNRTKGVLKLLLPEICNLMSNSNGRSNKVVLRSLSVLLLQTMKGHKWDADQTEAFNSAMLHSDFWTQYQIGRSATRYGHPDKAKIIFNNLSDVVSSENHQFWLLGLSQISEAEESLIEEDKEVVLRITEANSKILEAATNIKASATPNNQQNFQINYLKCRSEFLQALVQLVYACNSLRTSPPPAIANAQAKQSHDELYR